jgi:hypothetical protein
MTMGLFSGHQDVPTTRQARHRDRGAHGEGADAHGQLARD